ncbi:hypothetical protein SAMN05216559_2366 [Halomicrobium zhouii]|uniref:Halobacterial output domain-containing protein n=1 Tax=Halomicrobium zhouii TaxID=767519 RepID=A0A1I6LAG9_9EURY|nr:HalOD1 output domain-containing protein [Halomicrobium zhouii]SFS00481.1 hypothetical protein SAMN05216559_2366 [Halomicrobium zhouii]
MESKVSPDERAEITTVVSIQDVLPSVAVAEAVADAEETDPGDLPPLYDAVDPDALDQIFREERVGTVAFEYCGYTVAIQDNDVVVFSR